MPWTERCRFASRLVLDRGRGLSGFLSRLSVLGLILAVAILLAVLAVMNGFEREMHGRILGLVPHVTVHGYANSHEWSVIKADLAGREGVKSAALMVQRDVLALRANRVDVGVLMGVEPLAWQRWRAWASPRVEQLRPGDIVLGAQLANRLGVAVGDAFRIVLPEGGLDGSAPPVLRRVEVVSVVSSGTELDEGLMLIDFDFALGFGGDDATATGVAIQLDDLFEAENLRWTIARELPPHLYVSDWTGQYGNLYAAIRLSRDLVTLLLLSIIAVAAFNVVSSLVLVVSDRRGAIAMLRAMGATRSDILWIFVLQGALIGLLGASVGLFLGWGLALALPDVAQGVEWLVGAPLLNTDVYPLNFLPVDVRFGDAGWLWVCSLLLCIAAAVLPAVRATRISIAATLSQSQI